MPDFVVCRFSFFYSGSIDDFGLFLRTELCLLFLFLSWAVEWCRSEITWFISKELWARSSWSIAMGWLSSWLWECSIWFWMLVKIGTSWMLCFVCDFLVSSFLEFSTFYDFLSLDSFFSLEFFRSLESDFDLFVGFSPDLPELLLLETRDLLREYFEFCEYLDSLVFERPCDPIEFADFLLFEPVPVWILPPSVDLLFAP